MFWLNYLKTEARAIGRAEFADILESTDWFASDLQTSLARLIKAGRVINIDSGGKRPKKPLHFDKKERLQLVAPVCATDRGMKIL